MPNELVSELLHTLQQEEHLTKRKKYLLFLGGCEYKGQCFRCNTPIFMDDFKNQFAMNFNPDCDCSALYGQDEVCNYD